MTFAGYLHDDTPEKLVERLAASGLQGAADAIQRLDGHFALTVKSGTDQFAAVDRVRSIPLFWGERNGETSISARASDLVQKQRLAVDRDQAAIFAMSGFCVAGKTLYRGLNELKPGEWISSIVDAPSEDATTSIGRGVRVRLHRKHGARS